ncbi:MULTISPECIES: nucleoside triphosphate pyrophosphatase [unclassified Fibrobacter]|uniref:Maf family protein n=1 Tax=unclassified Fibrobacter TaxID=2634177 RepID=UPI0009236865|nr:MULTISPECIES: Maf family protein [unclassified Fibrobacter]OWV06979.1 septum formation protein Maf [Fibrobacter sp. UWH3]SHK24006.1 septum formation protein [Fibrobacter sp. UWH6]
MKSQIVLGSGSPRRSEILKLIGVDFRVVVSNEDENPKSTDPLEFPRENATIKALAVSRMERGAVVLGFDTLVFLDGVPLGKPKSEADALDMLSKLNGRGHKVITGVAIARDGKLLAASEEETEVVFRNNTLQELQEYVNSRDPMDKAGAYGIQTAGARLIQGINGCYYNVVGLPVARTLQMLSDLKVEV